MTDPQARDTDTTCTTARETDRHALTGLERPLCVIDSEWTRGSASGARLVTLAIARLLEDGRTEEHHWTVNPGEPIDPAVTAVHGITDADVEDKPPFARIAGEVAAVLEGADIAGYSVPGDLQILERELAAAGVTLQTAAMRIVDPLRLWQAREPRKLTDAYRRFVGETPDGLQAHDALDDLRMTVAVIERMGAERTAAQLRAEGNPHLVDPAGRFRLDEQRRIVFAFGQHRGAPAGEHPDFLEWMLGKNFPPSTLAIARQALERSRTGQRDDGRGAGAEPGDRTDDDVPF